MGLGLRLRTCLDYTGYLQACQKRASLASGSTDFSRDPRLRKLIPQSVAPPETPPEDPRRRYARIDLIFVRKRMLVSRFQLPGRFLQRLQPV